MEPRYISNNLPAQALDSSPAELLKKSLEKVLKHTPPLQRYTSRQSGGLFSGYTGLAYLFLQLSASHPGIRVSGHDLRFWAGKYLEGERGDLILTRGNCGLSCEKLSLDAVRACYSGSNDDIVDFLSNIPLLVGPYSPSPGDPFCSEIVNGRAGALYMLRMIRNWNPGCESFLETHITSLSEIILRTDDDGRGNWEWHGKRYFGAAHGEIGIITQLVLTTPSLAPSLSKRLEHLLDLQWSDGNWPSSERKMKEGKAPKLVQWCHGASGFIISLRALRPHFPNLQDDIDNAIQKAQQIVWRHGLLTKEPSLCHGIFGNSLLVKHKSSEVLQPAADTVRRALPKGPRRDHFLALTTSEAVQRVRHHDSALFAPASYDKDWSVLMNYNASAAWSWAHCLEENPPFIMYTDV